MYLASGCFKYILFSIQQFGQTKVRNLHNIHILNWKQNSKTAKQFSMYTDAQNQQKRHLSNKFATHYKTATEIKNTNLKCNKHK